MQMADGTKPDVAVTINLKAPSSGRKSRALLQTTDIEIEATAVWPTTVTKEAMSQVTAVSNKLQETLSSDWTKVLPTDIIEGVKITGVSNVIAAAPTVQTFSIPDPNYAAPPSFKSDDENDKKKVGLGVGLGLGLGIPLIALLVMFAIKRNKQHVAPTPKAADGGNNPFATAA